MTEPKPACVINGVPWWDYLFEYEMDGARFGFSVRATSEADAHERLRKMSFARYLGQGDGVEIPLSRGGFLVPLIAWWRNLRRV